MFAEWNWSVDFEKSNIARARDRSARLEVSRMDDDLVDAVGFRVDVRIVQAMDAHSYGKLRGLSVHDTKRENSG